MPNARAIFSLFRVIFIFGLVLNFEVVLGKDSYRGSIGIY